MGKSIWILSLVNILTATVLGFFTKPMISLAYFPGYKDMNVNSFLDIFLMMFNDKALTKVFPLIIIFVMLFFSCCISLSIIEKHFRVGKLMLKTPFKQINNYFLPVLLCLVILSLIIFVYGLLQSGMISLLHLIFSGSDVPSVINVIIAPVISLGLFVLVMFFGCSAMYWAPLMMIYGYSFRDACAEALRMFSNHKLQVLWGIIFPFVAVAIVESVFLMFKPMFAICVAVNSLLYLFLIIYVVCFTMVSLFDITGLTRRDLRKYY